MSFFERGLRVKRLSRYIPQLNGVGRNKTKEHFGVLSTGIPSPQDAAGVPAHVFRGGNLRRDRKRAQSNHQRDGQNLRGRELRRAGQSPAPSDRYRDEPVVIQDRSDLPNPLILL